MDQNNDDRGIDLSHALDDSSSRVKFEGEEWQHSARSFQTPALKIVEWVIKYSGGYIKDEKQAQYALIGFVAVAIIFISIFVFNSGGSKAEFKAPPGQKIIYPENAPPRLEERF